MIRVYREVVVRRDLDFERTKTLDLPKVDLVVPALRDGRVRVEDAIADVEALPASALRAKYAKAETETDSTPAPDETEVDDQTRADSIDKRGDPEPEPDDRSDVALTTVLRTTAAPESSPLLSDLMRAQRLLRSALSRATAGHSTESVRQVLDDLGGLVEAIEDAIHEPEAGAPAAAVPR